MSAAPRRTGPLGPIAYPDLPITERRDELLRTIAANQVVIVAGETGSGKSTQLPKLCLELGRGVAGVIGHTQPRRLAARSIADRVASELHTVVGGVVGYKVRFAEAVGPNTSIKLMTDGILLNEIHHDRRLRRYDTIIVDEAHERGLNTDFILGYLRSLVRDRTDLKVIVTSATIDTERFSTAFGDAPVIEVSGRTYPVEVRYRPMATPDSPADLDQPDAIAAAVAELAKEGRGDVLVFVSGEREIRDAVSAIEDLDLPHTETLQLFGRLPAAEQQRIFRPGRGRRVIVATNVAETSLTVPGIRYVVDAGTARISRFSRRTKVQQLPIEPISRASADQRAGRCGRLGPGICIRLYGEDDYEARPEFTEPEIQRTSVAAVILQMAALDLGDIETFPFLDPPDRRQVRDGIALLEELGAVDPEQSGTPRWLTPIGRRLSRLPIDPRLGRAIVAANRNGCLRDVLVIVSAMAIQDPRERPMDQRERADQMHARFRHSDSDFVTWLDLWDYISAERRARTSNQFRKMCREEFLNYRRLREWQDVHSQLAETARELGMATDDAKPDVDAIHRSLLTGLLSHVGMRDPDATGYRGARGSRFRISPASTLFKKRPAWVVAGELVETTHTWAHSAAPIDPESVEMVGAHLVSRSHSDPWWDPDRGEAVAYETVSLFGLPLVAGRVVGYGSIDADVARDVFIRHALVAGEWDEQHRFVQHNSATIAEVLDRERRERRHDLLASDDAVVEFFASRLPEDVAGVSAFNRWWKEARRDTPHLLDLNAEVVTAPEADEEDAVAFPTTWSLGDIELPLHYEFDTTSAVDGVTVDVLVGDLDRLDPAAFEWHVPGYRYELIEALIRSLPKAQRKRFAPIRDAVAAVIDDLRPDEGGLLESLRRTLGVMGGEPLPVDAFDLGRLPAHLRPRFRVLGDDGRVLGEGDDLVALKAGLVEETRAVVSSSQHPIETTGATSWTFGPLPAMLEVAGPSGSVTAYPTLVDEGASVAVRLVATSSEQADLMWSGVRRLLLLSNPGVASRVSRLVTKEGRAVVAAGPHASVAAWAEDCVAAAADRILETHGAPVMDESAFLHLRDEVDDRLGELAFEVATESLELLDGLDSLNQELAATLAPPTTVADIEEQRDRLFFEGFVSAIGLTRIADLSRYVTAMRRRLATAVEKPARDERLTDTVRELEGEWERLVAGLGLTPRLAEIDWMLQELRVSLFAQQVGTRFSVSEKSVRAALRAAVE